MRRATIEEAAQLLGVGEDEVRLRINSGTLVTCQEPQFRGCVWLGNVAEAPSGAKAKPQSSSKRTRSTKRAAETQPTPVSEEANAEAPAEARKPRSSKRAAAAQPAPGTEETGAQSPAEPKRTRSGKRAAGAQAAPAAEEASAQAPAEPRRPQSSQRTSAAQPGIAAGGVNGHVKEGQHLPPAAPPSAEAQLLQETVAMLKDELAARDRQLELKDAEIQARREEVQDLLAVLQQNRALPSASERASVGGDIVPVHQTYSAVPLLERIAWAARSRLANFSRLLFRNKDDQSARERH